MQTVYSTKLANIVVSKESHRQIVKTTSVGKKPVSQSNHDAEKNHLSQWQGVTMYNEKEIEMFDLDRQYILMSALQKAIRWCEVNNARFFAQELMDMDSKPATVLNRLIIIASEDVGLADPSLIFHVRNLYDEFENKREQNGIKKANAFKFQELREIVDRAVIAAALCYKSRITAMSTGATLYDIYQNETFNENVSVYLRRFAEAVEIRDEKQALYNAFVAGIFFDYKNRISTFIKEQGDKRNDILIQGWAEEYKRDSEMMVLAGCVLMLCRDLTSTHGEYKNAIDKHFPLQVIKAQIPDRAYDKHTKKGRMMGRGLKHFFEEAATVKNERFPNDWQKTAENAYYSGERKGFKRTTMLIDAINDKYKNAQNQAGTKGILTL
jgi:replication-associated recombination protein RarA